MLLKKKKNKIGAKNQNGGQNQDGHQGFLFSIAQSIFMQINSNLRFGKNVK
jgi:hypothetical protein